jgi:hypothetical protein
MMILADDAGVAGSQPALAAAWVGRDERYLLTDFVLRDQVPAHPSARLQCRRHRPDRLPRRAEE